MRVSQTRNGKQRGEDLPDRAAGKTGKGNAFGITEWGRGGKAMVPFDGPEAGKPSEMAGRELGARVGTGTWGSPSRKGNRDQKQREK